MPFDQLRETLLKGGIAPGRVRRYLAELDDHLAELIVAQNAAGYAGEDAEIRARALLGSDAELAAPWLADAHFKGLAARAPWAVFGMMVPFVVTLAYVVPTLLLVGLAKLHGFMVPGSTAEPLWFRALAQGLALGANLILPLVLGIGLTLLARNQRLAVWWPLLGATLIALIAMQIHIIFPTPDHHGGSISVGALIWWSSTARHHDGFVLPLMLAQAALALMPVTIVPMLRLPPHSRIG